MTKKYSATETSQLVKCLPRMRLRPGLEPQFPVDQM